MVGTQVKVAAVDIGTNTARLYVASVQGSDLIEEIRIARVCGLGRGVDDSGRLSTPAIARTVAVLEDFRVHVDDVPRVRVIATSASRDAANRDEFFDAAERVFGHRPELISGSEEAELSFAGATSDRDDTGPVLVIDIGGGSTEFVFGRSRPEYARSIDMGSVRLTDRLLGARPVDRGGLEAARREVRAALEPITIPGRPDLAIGVAGTFTSLVAMVLQLPVYDRRQVHQSRLNLEAVTELVRELATRSIEETAAIPSLDPERAPVILGGAIVAEQTMATLGLGEITVSEHDILDGVARSLLPQ